MKLFRHFTSWIKIPFSNKDRLLGTDKKLFAAFRFLSLALSAALVLCLLPRKFPEKVQAASGTQEVANVVVFVKGNSEQDKAKDVFNAGSNWSMIKQMYNTGTNGVGGYNNSFSNYISVVTEGKVHVTNYFPQETGGSQVKVLEVPSGYLGEAIKHGDALVNAVIDALGDSLLNASAAKYDNVKSGVLDNLTIIIQDPVNDSNSSSPSSFKSSYSDSKTAGGLHIGTYNVLYASFLVTDDGKDLAHASRQGVIAHEFLHTLGLPDLYRLNGSSGDPVGRWDIMANAIPYPQYPLSYLRAKQGWISMKTITQSGTYTLTAVSESGDNKVFVLKTPLSDTEMICIEYRKKVDDYSYFESAIPSSGLLLYRVDNKVEDLTNTRGKNYIYVYRPGVTDPEDATDKNSNDLNLLWDAALDGSLGKGSYGSTDLSADFTQNTLYYSDGRNSGIRISDVKLSGNTATFTVTFAEYDSVDLWEKVGDSQGTDVSGEPCLYSDPDTGALYLAYAENNSLYVKRWSGSAWQQLGSAIPGASDPALAVCDGILYLSCANASNTIDYYKLNGTSFSKIAAYSDTYPMYSQFIVDGSELYSAYQSNNRFFIWDIKTGTLITNSLSGADYSQPTLVKLGDCFYMVCAESKGFSGNLGGHIKMYDTVKKTWTTVYTLSNSFTNQHQLVKQGQKLYAFAGYYVPGGYQENRAVFAEFDGNSWSSSSIPDMLSANTVSMDVIGSDVYLTYYDTASHRTKVLKHNGSSYQLYDDTLGTSLSHVSTCNSAGTLYAVTKAENTNYLTVWKKTVSTTQTETPSVGQNPLELTLTPPTGYEDSHIYVDGIEYEAKKASGSYSVTLPDTSGKTAVMYSYNANGVPVGMYVWKLSWQGEICKATPLPGLQDLLSYHGFSIRIVEPAGIRFKSGIDASVKQRLLNSGIDGCRLKEYGTLSITGNNSKKFPLVKGGTAVSSGRAYYQKSDGSIYDMVFETVSGRNRFASVLTKIPTSAYGTEMVFRSYAVLDCGGQELVIYGPPVRRSIYTVAVQVKNAGIYKQGTSAYNYIQAIIDSVEKK
ncbi:MAG: hypothetical protein NC489_17310 [Ruminococcus flavefaciens]|nr:hypothetical protein [Ruminococcus flavefaciens]